MFTSIFNRAASKALLGAALIAVSMSFIAPCARGQVLHQFVFSPAAQRVLDNVMSNSDREGRQLVRNAIRKIGPQRAEAQLAQLSVFSPYELQLIGQVYASIAQVLPRGYRQTFVNGLFQATPEEEHFAGEMINAYARALNASVSAGPSNADFLFAQRMLRILTMMNRW